MNTEQSELHAQLLSRLRSSRSVGSFLTGDEPDEVSDAIKAFKNADFAGAKRAVEPLVHRGGWILFAKIVSGCVDEMIAAGCPEMPTNMPVKVEVLK